MAFAQESSAREQQQGGAVPTATPPEAASPRRERPAWRVPGPFALRRMWVATGTTRRTFTFSSRRLWLFSIALHRGGYTSLAKFVKNVNSFLYKNSLPPEAEVAHSVSFGHWGFGIIIHPKVVIGENVKIFQHVTMAVDPPLSPYQIVIERNVQIGANAVIKTRRNRGIRIGEGSRVGAGAVVTRDVPPGMIAISQPVELRPLGPRRKPDDPD